MHIFYFGRYWNRIEYIIDVSELYDIAYKVNLTGCELVKHGNRPKSDYIDFYEGRMEHIIDEQHV